MANISSEVRREALERDNFQCRECGVLIDPYKKGSYHLHHRDYKTNGTDSLITLCVKCHRNTDHGGIHILNSITSIQVSKETRERLVEIAHKGDTYDDIINRAIDAL